MPASPTPTAAPASAPFATPLTPTAPPATVLPLFFPYPTPNKPPAAPPAPPPPNPHPGLPFLVGNSPYAIAPAPLNLSDPLVVTGILDPSHLPPGNGGSGVTALTGDVTGTASGTTINTTLDASGVTAGSYAKVTVDAKGRVTAGGTLAAGDIPNNAANTSGTAVAFTGPLAGDVTGTQGATVASAIGGKTAAQVASAVTLAHVQNTDTGSSAPTFTVNALAVDGNATVTGNLTVSGEVQYTDSTHINVGDAFLNLIDTITTHAGNVDGGYAVKRYKSDNSATRSVKNYWSEANKQWQYDITDSTGDTLTTAVRAALYKQMTCTGDSSTTSFALTHTFNNRYPTVLVIDATTNTQVDVLVTYTSLSVVTITFGTAPATGQNYYVAITG